MKTRYKVVTIIRASSKLLLCRFLEVALLDCARITGKREVIPREGLPTIRESSPGGSNLIPCGAASARFQMRVVSPWDYNDAQTHGAHIWKQTRAV